jgi:hypothetical protein
MSWQIAVYAVMFGRSWDSFEFCDRVAGVADRMCRPSVVLQEDSKGNVEAVGRIRDLVEYASWRCRWKAERNEID